VSPANGATERHFYEVIDWASYQYADHRKVPSPPWKWFRVQRALLSSPHWLALSDALQAAFIRVLGAASETGNMIPDDVNWLRVRGLNRRTLASLVRQSMVTRFSLPEDHQRIKQLRRILSGGAPDTEDRGQRTESESDSEDRAGASVEVSTRRERSPLHARSPMIPEGDKCDASPRPRIRRGPRHVSEIATEPSNGHDPRPFPAVKALVLEIARAFNKRDAASIHKLGGQARNLSLRQVEVAVRQLIEDGEL
jgi:hypothetical protein